MAGTGVLLHALVIEGSRAEFDAGALHGRSRVEAGISFVSDPRQVPKGRCLPLVWVAMDPNPHPRYVGVVASFLLIDPEAKIGFKDLVRQASQMIAALRGKVDVGALNAEERRALKAALIEYSPDLWERADPKLHQALEGD